MNDNTFYDWFFGILPRLKDNAVIVMDNASYHLVKKNPVPMAWKKGNIIQWLKSINCVIDGQILIDGKGEQNQTSP